MDDCWKRHLTLRSTWFIWWGFMGVPTLDKSKKITQNDSTSIPRIQKQSASNHRKREVNGENNIGRVEGQKRADYGQNSNLLLWHFIARERRLRHSDSKEMEYFDFRWLRKTNIFSEGQNNKRWWTELLCVIEIRDWWDWAQIQSIKGL